MNYRVFNIGFEHRVGQFEYCQDETQFDVQDGDIDTMMAELKELFSEFCKENRFKEPYITYIEEVPFE